MAMNRRFYITCDSCGVETDDHHNWATEARRDAKDAGFVRHQGQDFCYGCWKEIYQKRLRSKKGN